jgi:hypothetical protein
MNIQKFRKITLVQGDTVKLVNKTDTVDELTKTGPATLYIILVWDVDRYSIDFDEWLPMVRSRFPLIPFIRWENIIKQRLVAGKEYVVDKNTTEYAIERSTGGEDDFIAILVKDEWIEGW